VKALIWRLAERRIRRALPPQSVDPVLGDLAEDFAAREEQSGAFRASVWLMAESRSLAAEYEINSHGRTAVTRMMRLSTLGNRLRDDSRLAVRRLRRQRAATIASIVTLACAIAAGAATWTLISRVLLNPLPVSSPDRLVVWSTQANLKGKLTAPYAPQIYPVFAALEANNAFDGLTGGGSLSLLVSAGGSAERRTVYFASHTFFDVIGVRLAAGRSFGLTDDQRGAPLTVLLSDRFWRSAFQADPGVIGRQISVAGKSATIIGITPPKFRGISLAESPDLYMPLRTIADVGSPFNNFFAETTHGSSPSVWISIIGRLKAGMSAGQTQAWARSRLDAQSGSQIVSLVPINVAAIPASVRPKIAGFARLLAGTIGLLLLIGGLTVGLLLLIRTEARRDEFAMCLALGASRRRLAAGVAMEGALLALAGSVAAMPLAWLLFRSLGAFKLPGGVDIGLLDLSMNWRVVAAAISCAAGVAVLVSVVASIFGFAADTSDALRAKAGATPRLSRRRTRSALVVAQVAITMTLVTGAGLFGRSLIASLSLNPGYEPSRLIDVSLGLAAYNYTPERTADFVERLRTRLSTSHDIRAIAVYQPGPMMTGRLTIDGAIQEVPTAVDYTPVDEHYFQTMGMRVVRGRDFTRDDRVDTDKVIIVSESLGRLIAGGGDPVGHRVKEPFSQRGKPAAVATVVGVVPDVVTNVTVMQPLSIYYAASQWTPTASRGLLIRATGDVDLAKAAAAAAIRELDPAVVPGPMPTFQQRITKQMAPQQFAALVLGVLGAIAVLLTVLGAYVLAESMAALRHRETGIRAALGASRGALTKMLAGQTMRLIGAGLLVGFGLSWAAAGLVRGFLFQVEPLDPTTLIASSALIVTTAFAVSLRPALVAARADLTKLLKDS
jgi:putative ABC transport system permease protein